MAFAEQRAVAPAGAVLTAALLLASSACTSRPARQDTQGVFISTRLPLASYVQAASPGSPGKGTKLFFPQLDIYDESGDLIYSSHESIENARVLKELPGSIQNLHPQPGAPRVAEIIQALPNFRAQEEKILKHHNVTVLSVFLENCHACTIQEDALDDSQRRLLDDSINVLVIRLSRP